MRNLPLPSRKGDRGHLQKAIRQYRYNGTLLGHDITPEEMSEVLALYDKYDSDLGAPSDLFEGRALAQTLCDAIYAAYDTTQEGRRLEEIRETVRKAVDLCPICGIDPAEELDHFLPRSVFKPLAIFTHNLVPLCHRCNNAKLAGFAVEGNNAFLHPYFDLLPDVDFLQADVEIKGNALSVGFAIDLGAALPDGFAGRLDAQIQTLDLKPRYGREVNTYISGHAISIHGYALSRGSEGVRNFLQLQARYETTRFYRNHWRPVLLRALAAHTPFIDGGFAIVLPVPQDMVDDIRGIQTEKIL